MKIVKKEPIGFLPVYDIGLLHEHNFLIQGGIFASNCFNKSHSVAYGYVTYQTAYLKANYPVEYMAALLSSVSDDTDKVQKYIASCHYMNINVLPPDINTSDVYFTPRGTDILFGLAAIKNLGMGAIEAILAARKERPFTSLGDLCKRVDSRALNKKALEALVQAGAFDRLHPNRKQTVANIEPTLTWASRRAKDKASGQVSLFDMMVATGEETFVDEPPAPPDIPDYLPQEKIELEKELLGFYLSAHPLKALSPAVKLLAPVNLSDLQEVRETVTVTAIVMITDLKNILTKNNEQMAVLQIEDLSGKLEAVVFPKVHKKVKEYLRKDNRVIVWGKVDRKDESVQLVVDDMAEIEQVSMMRLELTREQALDIQTLHRLREILKNYSGGRIPIIAQVEGLNQAVRLGNQFWVRDVETTRQALTAGGFRVFADPLMPTTATLS
ncbi:MAG: OB-fold nucleic acid binding domain-containing protein [Pseudanabaenaceae cyanobacterium SKYGB_i_bin29]|nr:OB-fold nucleic acid binding domain-containing protein [Pseudanabaenaceae cyanobacterium SKYG29]MDW8422394.1 OB-fold nucleic acid binding domain-containing protein [Pseudanabaenaceae cyanobacterium SKYGB_i_bin29]